jgi:hypothetical protein
MHDINRELISTGFDKPELFEVFKDTKKVDPESERRYLQLWLNQLSMFHSMKEANALQKDFEESCARYLRDMFEKANMLRHWKNVGEFYPVSFQKAVNAIINETGNETVVAAAKEPMSYNGANYESGFLISRNTRRKRSKSTGFTKCAENPAFSER